MGAGAREAAAHVDEVEGLLEMEGPGVLEGVLDVGDAVPVVGGGEELGFDVGAEIVVVACGWGAAAYAAEPSACFFPPGSRVRWACLFFFDVGGGGVPGKERRGREGGGGCVHLPSAVPQSRILLPGSSRLMGAKMSWPSMASLYAAWRSIKRWISGVWPASLVMFMKLSMVAPLGSPRAVVVVVVLIVVACVVLLVGNQL